MPIAPATFHQTTLNNVILIQTHAIHDHRGFNSEIYDEGIYCESLKALGIENPPKFLQDTYSRSTQNVFRGIHGDEKRWKLVFCTLGEVELIVVDCREESPSFGKHEHFILSDKNFKQVLIPPRFGNGHLVLSPVANFVYKQSAHHDKTSQFTFKYNDPRFNIKLSVEKPITSERDAPL